VKSARKSSFWEESEDDDDDSSDFEEKKFVRAPLRRLSKNSTVANTTSSIDSFVGSSPTF